MILWGPTGVTGAIPKWMSLNQNITPANILVKDADVHINAFPITVIHNFGIAGRFAQVMVNAVPGNVTATLLNQPTDNELPTSISVNANGFIDGFIGFKLGLINQPALNLKEYATYKHKTFSMTSYTRIWYPGSYDKNEDLNREIPLGSCVYFRTASWFWFCRGIGKYWITANHDPICLIVF